MCMNSLCIYTLVAAITLCWRRLYILHIHHFAKNGVAYQSINQSILLLKCTVPIGTRAWTGPVQHLQQSTNEMNMQNRVNRTLHATYTQQLTGVHSCYTQPTAEMQWNPGYCTCRYVVASRPPIVPVGISMLHISSTNVPRLPLHHCHIPCIFSPVWSPPSIFPSRFEILPCLLSV